MSTVNPDDPSVNPVVNDDADSNAPENGAPSLATGAQSGFSSGLAPMNFDDPQASPQAPAAPSQNTSSSSYTSGTQPVPPLPQPAATGSVPTPRPRRSFTTAQSASGSALTLDQQNRLLQEELYKTQQQLRQLQNEQRTDYTREDIVRQGRPDVPGLSPRNSKYNVRPRLLQQERVITRANEISSPQAIEARQQKVREARNLLADIQGDREEFHFFIYGDNGKTPLFRTKENKLSGEELFDAFQALDPEKQERYLSYLNSHNGEGLAEALTLNYEDKAFDLILKRSLSAEQKAEILMNLSPTDIIGFISQSDIIDEDTLAIIEDQYGEDGKQLAQILRDDDNKNNYVEDDVLAILQNIHRENMGDTIEKQRQNYLNSQEPSSIFQELIGKPPEVILEMVQDGELDGKFLEEVENCFGEAGEDLAAILSGENSRATVADLEAALEKCRQFIAENPEEFAINNLAEAEQALYYSQNMDRVLDRAIDHGNERVLEDALGIDVEFEKGGRILGKFNQFFVKPAKGMGVLYNFFNDLNGVYENIRNIINGNVGKIDVSPPKMIQKGDNPAEKLKGKYRKDSKGESKLSGLIEKSRARRDKLFEDVKPDERRSKGKTGMSYVRDLGKLTV